MESVPVGSCVEKEQAILCLKNFAILHAKFWGNKEFLEKIGSAKTDRDYRPSRYSKLAAQSRNGIVSSSESFRKKVEKALSSEWPEHPAVKLPKNAPKPDWLTIEPLEDGTYVVMKDPLVLEMFKICEERLPNYNRQKSKDFIKKEPQSLLHGDSHAGNHMYGTGENEGKIIAVDFQMAGSGLVTVDLVYFLVMSWRVRNYDEIEELIKGKYFDEIGSDSEIK